MSFRVENVYNFVMYETAQHISEFSGFFVQLTVRLNLFSNFFI